MVSHHVHRLVQEEGLMSLAPRALQVFKPVCSLQRFYM
jgi:hypothetical protein